MQTGGMNGFLSFVAKIKFICHESYETTVIVVFSLLASLCLNAFLYSETLNPSNKYWPMNTQQTSSCMEHLDMNSRPDGCSRTREV